MDKIINLAADEMASVIEKEAAHLNASIDLARALMKNSSWATIAKILSGLKGENEESIRRMIMSYCNTILLKSDNYKAFLILDEFAEPFYNTGKPGLTLACYKVLHAED